MLFFLNEFTENVVVFIGADARKFNIIEKAHFERSQAIARCLIT